MPAPTPQQQLDAINNAILNGGVVRVRFPDGSEVQYSTLPDLLRAREIFATELAALSEVPITGLLAFGRVE